MDSGLNRYEPGRTRRSVKSVGMPERFTKYIISGDRRFGWLLSTREIYIFCKEYIYTEEQVLLLRRTICLFVYSLSVETRVQYHSNGMVNIYVV